MTSHTFDVVVLGAGPGGYVAAIRAAQRGASVALVEREFLGGTCLNWGCIPSKTIIASAELFHLIRHAQDFGLAVDNVRADWSAILARRDAVVAKLRQGIASLLKAYGVSLFQGTGSLLSRREVKVTQANSSLTLAAKNIIIATGSEAARPPAFPFDNSTVHDSRSFFEHVTRLPDSIIIVGGGVIGCEFASLLNSLGVKVTIIELLDRLLPIEDPEISKALTKHFEKTGITVKTSVKVENVTVHNHTVSCDAAGQRISASMMLVAVGRTNNISNIGLESLGIKTDKNTIVVNERMETSVPGIYAIGDITGKAQLAHVASAQAHVAADNATGARALMNYRLIPNCIFTTPEIGTVGLSATAATQAGYSVKIGSFPYAALGKALAIAQPDGFYRIVADAKTDEILGVQIFGTHATDLIAEAVLAMRLECTSEELAQTIHAHPTLPEGLMEAAHAVHGRSIHQPPPRRS
ncbi:MAG: dihydrolipoyl dehydrogenase [bacterium]|nr:dihydrolipoyl dehydrogenase [bacterium]